MEAWSGSSLFKAQGSICVQGFKQTPITATLNATALTDEEEGGQKKIPRGPEAGAEGWVTQSCRPH